MGDLLTEARENVITNKLYENAKIFTIATLTGHVGRAYGPYPAAVENGQAVKKSVGRTLQDIGQIWGDPFEVSRIRREDYMVNSNIIHIYIYIYIIIYNNNNI